MKKIISIDFLEIFMICILVLTAIAIVWAGVEIVVDFIKDIQLHGGVLEYLAYLFKEM